MSAENEPGLGLLLSLLSGAERANDSVSLGLQNLPIRRATRGMPGVGRLVDAVLPKTGGDLGLELAMAPLGIPAPARKAFAGAGSKIVNLGMQSGTPDFARNIFSRSGDRLAGIAEDLGIDTVTEKMANGAARHLQELSISRIRQKFGNTVRVYHGGRLHRGAGSAGEPVSVTTNRGVAERFAARANKLSGQGAAVHAFEIPSEKVLFDGSLVPGTFSEDELLVYPSDLIRR